MLLLHAVTVAAVAAMLWMAMWQLGRFDAAGDRAQARSAVAVEEPSRPAVALASVSEPGPQLRREARDVRVGDRTIDVVCAQTVRDAEGFFAGLVLSEKDAAIAEKVLSEIRKRLGFLRDVGLAEERQHRVDQALHRVHWPPVRRASMWARVVGAEQLEGCVDEVELHRLCRPA